MPPFASRAQQEVRHLAQSLEEEAPLLPPPTDGSGDEGVAQAEVGGGDLQPSDEGMDSGRPDVVEEERVDTHSADLEREVERQRERDRERMREMERDRDMERELAGVMDHRPHRGAFIRATFTRPGADADRDSERDRDPFDDVRRALL